MRKIISHSLEETQKIAHDWLDEIKTRMAKADKATIVGLSGHLGAGKTAFVKAVAKELEIKEVVTSPTFVLMKMYGVEALLRQGYEGQAWPRQLIHIDAYRLERPEELTALGFEKLAADRSNLIMIEWPEKVGILEHAVAQLEFETKGADFEINFRK